jgi:hypothetical protein
VNKRHCELVFNTFAKRGTVLDGDGISCNKLFVDYICRHTRLKVGCCANPADVNNIFALERKAGSIIGQSQAATSTHGRAHFDRCSQAAKSCGYSVVEAVAYTEAICRGLSATRSYFENEGNNVWVGIITRRVGDSC